ncbi:phage terminase large subunit [Hymenobacter sp. 15J16-1T3B]|uniref:phage terminase large subunit n=1 Tax=Hymenobacter sp. 15J16-1T3B TaxID=2886941 RepID=UPI001D12D7FA|nr:phage terminase large subunit [Hymenobacter sp. 15J16-1T3B]MCC3159692.1 phage terminase large subunit [Hymenobacter sp. 15J16-1T3B]
MLSIDVQEGACSPAFYPHLLTRVRFFLLWGGRDGTKSDFTALHLLLACLSLPYFKCILIRKVFNTIGESQVATLRKVAEREGLLPYFEFRAAPLMIKCTLNGNSFICRGLDDPARLKSVSDPTHAWYEEANQISEEEANYVSTSLRSSHPGAVIQEVYTFNPDHEGDYREFWLWQKFFDRTGNPNGTSFSGQLAVDVNGQLIEQPYRVIHTTYRDNPWCPPDRAATYESYAATDPYRHRVWALGLWATKQTGNEFYHAFSRSKHVQPCPYVLGRPIFTGWDANALPYSAMLCCQPIREGEKLRIQFFKEYTLGPPNNGVRPTAKQFLIDRKVNGWQSSDLFITGDASMRSRQPGRAERDTLFNDIEAELLPALNNASDRWHRRNPEVMRRRDFINWVFAGGLPNVEVVFDPSMGKTIVDLEQVQTGVDGKHKARTMDKELGVAYEHLGHCSDDVDYLLTAILQAQYEAFKAGR